MKYRKLIFILLLSFNAIAEDKSKWYDEFQFKLDKSSELYKTQKLDKDNWHNVAKNILSNSSVTGFDVSDYSLSNSRWAIIIVHHSLKKTGAGTGSFYPFEMDKKGVKTVVLHREKKEWKSGYEWSEYLLNTRKNIAFIFLGNTGVDTKGKKINNELKNSKQKSFFSESAKDLVSLAKELFSESDGSDIKRTIGVLDDLSCKVILVRNGKVNTPTTIGYKVPYIKSVIDSLNPLNVKFEVKDLTQYSEINKILVANKMQSNKIGTVSFKAPNQSYNTEFKKSTFKIHEKNRFAFTIGVTASQFNYQNFNLDSVRNVVVAGDSASIANWKSNFMVNIEFYPFGRDVDRLESIFKGDFRRFHTRFGLYGGLKLAKNPFDQLQAGFVFSVSKTFSISGGWAWDFEQAKIDGESEEKDIGDITDLDSAKGHFDQYGRSNFTIGFSFAPSEIVKLFVDKEKD